MRKGIFTWIIYLGVDWEASSQKHRQHFLISKLARRLEGNSMVLGVERPICFFTSPFLHGQKFIKWMFCKGRLRKAGSNLYIYTPFVFLHNIIAARIPGITKFNRFLLRIQLMHILNKLNFDTSNLLAWIHHPYQLEDVGLLGERWLVYDCYDDYTVSQRSATCKSDLEGREATILKKADFVFFSSAELLRFKGGGNTNVHLIPNGVEFEHFNKTALKDKISITEDYSTVIGFTGKISTRLDFQLLLRIAEIHRDWRIVMIGPYESKADFIRNPDYCALRSAPNVNLCGPRLYQELPDKMRSFDVCILPYRVDDPFNMRCSPLKLYEYLATGKPIVSTNIPAVRPFDGLVRVARDAEEFESHVVMALAEQDEALVQQRLLVAQENSWKRRVAKILEIFDAAFERESS